MCSAQDNARWVKVGYLLFFRRYKVPYQQMTFKVDSTTYSHPSGECFADMSEGKGS